MVTQVITYPLTTAEMDGETDQSFQFSRQLTEEELDDMMGDEPDQSTSSRINSKKQTARGGATAELVNPEYLTDDGRTKKESKGDFN